MYVLLFIIANSIDTQWLLPLAIQRPEQSKLKRSELLTYQCKKTHKKNCQQNTKKPKIHKKTKKK